LKDLPADVHLTDIGNAKRLVARYGEDFRYCFPLHRYYIWDGVRWVSDDSGRMEAWAKETALSIYHEAANCYQQVASLAGIPRDEIERTKLEATAKDTWAWAKKSEAANRIAAMIELAKSEPGIPIVPAEFDRNPWLFNCENGTIDLHTGELQAHQRGDYLTKLAPVEYDPAARLELWEHFLSESLPDVDTREYVQRCAGATIVGLAKDDVLLICHGPGGTGKGTFLNGFLSALGDYGAASELSTFTAKRDAHGPQPDMARLRGCRMVAISEVEPGGTITLLKRATGGDPITTRSHHQESFQFIPQFTIWIICNDRPRVPDSDSGIWRRMREVPFTVKFPEPDTNIRPTLSDPTIAGPAILAWAVGGCLAYQEHGLGNLPSQAIEATKAYRIDMDPLADWREENTIESPESWTPFKQLFADYQTWAKDAGVRHPVGRKTFGQRIAEHFESAKGPGGTRGNRGLALKSGDCGISEMPLTPGGAVDPHIYSSHRGNPTDQMPPNATSYLTYTQDEMPHTHDLEMGEPLRNDTAPGPWDVIDDDIGI